MQNSPLTPTNTNYVGLPSAYSSSQSRIPTHSSSQRPLRPFFSAAAASRPPTYAAGAVAWYWEWGRLRPNPLRKIAKVGIDRANESGEVRDGPADERKADREIKTWWGLEIETQGGSREKKRTSVLCPLDGERDEKRSALSGTHLSIFVPPILLWIIISHTQNSLPSQSTLKIFRSFKLNKQFAFPISLIVHKTFLEIKFSCQTKMEEKNYSVKKDFDPIIY